jgi:hypothetical protein
MKQNLKTTSLGMCLNRMKSNLLSVRLEERAIYVMIGLLIVAGMIMVRVAPDFLESVYLAEDGILEWLTVAVLVFCAFLCFQRAVRLRSVRPALFVGSLIFLGFVFIFGAGEELSWGQRIFGVETPEWLEKHNKQQELNVHNLMLGDFSVNRRIFGTMFTLMLASYLFFLPSLAGRFTRIGRLVERFGLPLPTGIQALAFLPAIILPDLLVPSGKSDELREACACLMLLILFCYPRNGYLYSPDWKLGDAS